MPLQATSGAASYDAFGGGVPVAINYIEDVFSSYLWTGNASSQTITNGIDLSTKGGMVWIKARSSAIENVLLDTTRGIGNYLVSNNTDPEIFVGNILTSVLTNGFDIGGSARANSSGVTYASWTLRKQPKFFDVVTFTGTQNSSGTGQVVSHNLGSTPGCVIIKPITDTSGTGFSIADWIVWHRSLSSNSVFLKLNSSASQNGSSDKIQAVSSTTFTAGWEVGYTGQQYVAYLFAHDAGGFGLTGTDNVISCGSYTGNGSATGPVVTLGYEPQWVLVKRTDSTSNWTLSDNMRGQPVDGATAILSPNLSDAEASATTAVSPTATGFQVKTSGATYNASGGTYIYIAIRRGPMKVPTSGTSVFSPIVATNSQGTENTTGFPLDMQIANIRSGYASNGVVPSRLTGVSSNTTSSGSYLRTPSTNAEQTGSDITQYWGNTGFQTSSNWAGSGMVYWNFRRAPSFFDEVCWTSDDTTQVLNHNLTVAPELIIRKPRSIADEWAVGFDFQASSYKKMALNTTAAQTSYGSYSSGEFPGKPTATQFTDQGSGSGRTFVAYLFATCAGVSKVGSYTGTGTTLQIDCGFTGGARFVLIKRTDSTGDWYVWDTARGIVSGNDPYLLLNSTAAEVTNTDYIDTYSAGFEISSTAPAAINASGGTFIFLAIA
jgi:hypothetical protein